MSHTIKVTIIIPAFNEELFLSQCIDSVLKQIVSFRIEVLVIDDCSADSTFAVAQSYAEKHPNIVKVFRNNKNLGPRATFLRGIKLSSADYFHVLDADDYWTYQYKLQTQVDFLDSHPDYSAVAHNTLTDYLKTGKKQQMISFDTGQLLANRPIDCATVMRGDVYFHTSSVLYRNIYKKKIPEFLYYKVGGDVVRLKMFSWHGNIHFFNEIWSVYQYTGRGIWSSLSAEEKKNVTFKAAFFFFRIAPLKYKRHALFYIAKCFNEFSNTQYQINKTFFSLFFYHLSQVCYWVFDKISNFKFSKK